METWLIMLAALVISSVLSWGLIPIAWRVGLVDKPCERKQHNGNIPLYWRHIRIFHHSRCVRNVF